MDLGLRNKIAVVTGASKGIGKGIAKQLLQEGATVIVSSSNDENLQQTYRELNVLFDDKVYAKKCDVNNSADVESLVSSVIEKFKKIDILVINYGGPKPGYFLDFDEDYWDKAYNQLLKSVIKLTKLVIPIMIENQWGRILTVTSSAVKQPIDNLILSNTFRSGVTAYNRTLSNQVAKYGITINNIAPGYIFTERIESLIKNRMATEGKSYDEIVKAITSEIPAGRIGTVEELASLATFICSEQASYITGQTFVVDGGRIKSLL
ncbi:MAG TPA: SDR family oxidoreductase [Ignavibacteriales bacterium]|nr:SDR family oxidoreductase [Ignavibacteriales bacterium]HOL81591.1 SDR family oxidoreductase [Ignavibacteriales bacterium]HOM65579.1 SDR family oxidoreductase [Ignavibacteriales bacterium]HPD67858.1 SDR family oxidoreductase [Ignavibacteriales bacterium]HPP33705.1 SDR family oxidoreductase [Ignavibacteriales bacterium]